MLTWPQLSDKSGGYVVRRSTTAGGPYVDVNGARVAGQAYVDDNNGSGLINGTSYYYVVVFKDDLGHTGTATSEVVAIPNEPPGHWTITVSATGTAPGMQQQSPTEFAIGQNLQTSLNAAAGLAGPRTQDAKKVAKSSYTGTWTAKWTGNSPTDWPDLSLFKEVQTQTANVISSGTGFAGVVSSDGHVLLSGHADDYKDHSQNDSNKTTNSIDQHDIDHVLFTIRNTHRYSAIAPVGNFPKALNDKLDETATIVHAYSPNYFQTHFHSPQDIAIAFNTQGTLQTTATLSAGTDASSVIQAVGTNGDVVTLYAPWDATNH